MHKLGYTGCSSHIYQDTLFHANAQLTNLLYFNIFFILFRHTYTRAIITSKVSYERSFKVVFKLRKSSKPSWTLLSQMLSHDHNPRVSLKIKKNVQKCFLSSSSYPWSRHYSLLLSFHLWRHPIALYWYQVCRASPPKTWNMSWTRHEGYT